MPKLVDKSYADAKAIIENNNLRLGETKRTSSQKPSGTVIGQSIEAGTEVDEYTVIDLTVSTGAAAGGGAGTFSGKDLHRVRTQG